jgi:tRNA nucleotidyltransferase (CCA-adding enzyme)
MQDLTPHVQVESTNPMQPGDQAIEAEAAFVRAQSLAHAVRDAGGRALIVGGWCRDRRLGRASKDIDLEVFGLSASDLRSLLQRFGTVQTVGEAFTVYKVGSIDVALPRRESKTARGHRGFEVRGDPAMSFEEAARRRDFTVNAIGFDPLSGQWLDPFGGAADLEHRLLRAVDPRTFGEDSLRVLRAVQFAARFDLAIDAATAALCRAIPLDDLPSERIWGEIEKLLLQAPRPSVGYRSVVPAIGRAGGLRARAGLAPRRRRVGPYPARDRQRGRTIARPGSRATVDGDARRGLS